VRQSLRRQPLWQSNCFASELLWVLRATTLPKLSTLGSSNLVPDPPRLKHVIACQSTDLTDAVEGR
jgi:hypothetical protein